MLKDEERVMDAWGGAQWVVVTLIFIRTFLGAARASGAITVKEPEQKPSLWGRYWSSRVSDAAIVLVLLWGNFF
jgi:hypothetical protein